MTDLLDQQLSLTGSADNSADNKGARARMGEVHSVDRVVIRFAGDSGDGMQLTGDRFTSDTARLGNDFSTLPNFPAEIRAPQGTVAGVSSFQVHFADFDIRTPGDRPRKPTPYNIGSLRLTENPRPLPVTAPRRSRPAAPGRGRSVARAWPRSHG